MSKDCLTCKWAKWDAEDDDGYRDGECKWEPSGPVPAVWSATRMNWLLRVPPFACGPGQSEAFVRVKRGPRIANCPAWEEKP